MRRSKPRQHVRRLRCGKKIIVNKGIKKRNYGYMPLKSNKTYSDKKMEKLLVKPINKLTDEEFLVLTQEGYL